MNAKQRRFALVARRLGLAEGGEDRLRASAMLGEGDEAAIVQLLRRSVEKLARVPEAAHQPGCPSIVIAPAP
ncbi:MAG: hypothetical protein QOH81_1234 [Sphingomonadales bacterium]|nr:hypothetical protein [Sphingomonadales bacterium]